MNKNIAKSQDSANESESETFVVGQSESVDASATDNDGTSANSEQPSTNQGRSRKKEVGLPEELSELVYELREAVKQINPKKHTKKSLRRSLAMVNDILDDINQMTSTKSLA